MLASVDGQLVPIPINLDTINTLYGTRFTAFDLADFYKSVAEPRAELKTSEDVIISQYDANSHLKPPREPGSIVACPFQATKR